MYRFVGEIQTIGTGQIRVVSMMYHRSAETSLDDDITMSEQD